MALAGELHRNEFHPFILLFSSEKKPWKEALCDVTMICQKMLFNGYLWVYGGV